MKQDRVVQRCMIVRWLAVIACAACTHIISAETLVLGTLPGKPRAAGFSMSVELEPTSGNGYHPLYLNFLPIGQGFARDRHLEVNIIPQHRGRTELDYVYRRPITISQGSGRITLPVYLPHYVPWDSISVELHENGQPIDKGTRSFSMPGGLRSRDVEQKTLVGILSADRSIAPQEPWETYPDVRTLVCVLGAGPLPEDATVHRLAHAAATKLAQRVQPAQVQFRPFDEQHLQQDWLGYSQLDVIMVAAPVLERIELAQPDRFHDLMSWLAAGGNLWVYAAERGLPESFLGRLKYVAMSARHASFLNSIETTPDLKGENDTSEWVNGPWDGVIKGSQSYSRRANLSFSTRKKVYAELEKEGHPFSRTGKMKRVLEGVKLGEFGLGFVLSIDSDDPFPGSFQFWNSIANSQEFGQLDFTERNGIDVPSGNANYWMWLIPSVGQPPVKSFVLLNTLFVVLIGPVCYWLLRKRRRLYFLYFVAPGLALLVTASLFAYAIGSDGTTTRVRSRQLTWIDAANGYHVEQARQTYYAVFGSGDGIELNADTAVFPVRHTPAFNRYTVHSGRSGRRGDLLVQDDRQALRGIFLPPRDQVQYLTMRPIPSTAGLAFRFEPEEESVQNDLSIAFSRILVSDRKGLIWVADEIGAGKSAPLRRAGPNSLKQVLGPSVLPPLGEVPMLRNNVVRLGGGMGGLQVSSLERRLQRWSQSLPQGRFVGLADVVDGRIGVDGANVLDSVHVVMGDLE